MKLLLGALSLIAVIATGVVIYIVVIWWNGLLKDPNVAMTLIWTLPTWAIDVACIALWKTKTRPQP